MRRTFGPVVLMIALFGADALAQPRVEENGRRHGWLSTLDEAKAQARKTGKPIMAVVRCVP